MARYIETYNHNHEIGVLVEFSTTDIFTLRTEEFRTLAKDIAVHIAATDPGASAHGHELLSLLTQRFVRDENVSIRELLQECERKLKTEVRITKYCRFGREP